MSFDKLKEEELRHAAELFAVDLDSAVVNNKLNRKMAAAAFAEEGVTYDMYTELVAQHEKARQELAEAEAKEAELAAQREAATIKAADLGVDDEDVEPEADYVLAPRKRKRPSQQDILVKMERQNPYYEVNGKVFTREHPFVLMTEDEAQGVFDAEWGFRQATPREAAEYYS